MRCPHCRVGIHEKTVAVEIGDYPYSRDLNWDRERWETFHQRCPECGEVIIVLRVTRETPALNPRRETFLAYPQGSSRPVPREVPDLYAQDFDEAARVLPHSEKASAALSRRCLQAVLRHKAGATPGNLYDEIEEVMRSGTVPQDIADSLHGVRVLGNFAAHPIKSTTTGMVVDVEPGEAEWMLDVLERLFDHFFVGPAATAKHKAAINAKLKETGKPPLP